MSTEGFSANHQSAIDHVLVSGIGYTNMSDMSFGRVLFEKMAEMDWPDNVHVEDLNFGPVMIYQWFEESPLKYDKLILVGAAKRGREPGALEVYPWNKPLPDAARVQSCIEEAITGVISLENLLVVCKHFNVLPVDVTIVEIEPLKEDWGLQLSPPVAARISEAVEIVRNEAMKARHR